MPVLSVQPISECRGATVQLHTDSGGLHMPVDVRADMPEPDVPASAAVHPEHGRHYVGDQWCGW